MAITLDVLQYLKQNGSASRIEIESALQQSNVWSVLQRLEKANYIRKDGCLYVYVDSPAFIKVDGKLFRDARESAGIGQREAAALVDWNRSALQRFENTKFKKEKWISRETVELFAEVYDVSVNYLLGNGSQCEINRIQEAQREWLTSYQNQTNSALYYL